MSYTKIEELASNYLKTSSQKAFHERFQTDLPEEINKSHIMVIIASELDPSSERIVQSVPQYMRLILIVFFLISLKMEIRSI